jgi:hypothetical protein
MNLQRAGIPITKGCDYGLDQLITGPIPSLEEVQKMLSSFKGSLADEIVKMRAARAEGPNILNPLNDI